MALVYWSHYNAHGLLLTWTSANLVQAEHTTSWAEAPQAPPLLSFPLPSAEDSGPSITSVFMWGSDFILIFYYTVHSSSWELTEWWLQFVSSSISLLSKEQGSTWTHIIIENRNGLFLTYTAVSFVLMCLCPEEVCTALCDSEVTQVIDLVGSVASSFIQDQPHLSNCIPQKHLILALDEHVLPQK